MSLSISNLDEAFGKRYQAKSDQVYQNSGLQAEKAYIRTDTKDNQNQNYLQTKNYRTTQYTQNPKYLFKRDQVYDLQGINDGKGPAMNIMVDDQLTRGNLSAKPNDRLAEQVTFIRHVNFLPRKTKTIQHDKFLVSTTLSSKPQTSFMPQFDTCGINCRHYNRKVDKYWRNKYQRQ